MPSVVFTASTASQVVARVPAHKVLLVSSFLVDNSGSTADVRARLARVLTPDPSNAVSAPQANRTEEMTYMGVGARLTGELGEDSLRDIRGIGIVYALFDGTWAQCRAAVQYHLE